VKQHIASSTVLQNRYNRAAQFAAEPRKTLTPRGQPVHDAASFDRAERTEADPGAAWGTGWTVFKTVARPASWSRVGSTPMHLRHAGLNSNSIQIRARGDASRNPYDASPSSETLSRRVLQPIFAARPVRGRADHSLHKLRQRFERQSQTLCARGAR